MFTDPLTRRLPDDPNSSNKKKSYDSSKRNASSDNLLDSNLNSDPPPLPQRRSSSTDRSLSNEKFSSPRRVNSNILASSTPANDILRRHEHRHKELLKMQDEKAQILSENKREEEQRQWLQDRISDLQNRRIVSEKELQSSDNLSSNERCLLQMDVEIDRLQKVTLKRFGSPEEIENRYRSRCDKVIHLEKQMLQLLKGGEEENFDMIERMSSSSLMSESATEQHIPPALCWSLISDHASSPSHLCASKSVGSPRRFEYGQLYQNFDPGIPPQNVLSHGNANSGGDHSWGSQSLSGGLEADNCGLFASGYMQQPMTGNNSALPRPHTAPCSQSNSFIAAQSGNGSLISDITPTTSGFIMTLSQDDSSANVFNVLKNAPVSGKPPTKRSTAIKELREANYSYPPPHLVPPSNQVPLSNRSIVSGKDTVDLSNQMSDMPSGPILEEHHSKVLDLLHQLQTYCAQMAGDLEMQESEEVFPGPAVAALMKLSFDEDYRQLISTLGGLETIADVLRVDYETFGHRIEQYQLTLRRHACMTLTNLTFGVGANKSRLCSMEPALGALVAQLESPNEDLKQVAASVVRNLSWRAEITTKQALRIVDTPRILTKSLLSITRESTLKSMLSALWNLSAHCAKNKAEICAVSGALEFMVSTLTYKSPSKTLAIIENGGGILRNISSVIAMRDDYREILRERQCLPILLRHLRSPSLTIVSNSCGTLWNLSYRCQRDQENLIELGAVGMLRCLVNSKHKMISTGSAAALKNLLGVAHNVTNSNNYQSTNSSSQSARRALSAGDKPILQARKLRALEADVERVLSEGSHNSSSLETATNSAGNVTPSVSSHSNTGSPMLQHLISSSDVARVESSESVRSVSSDQDKTAGSTTQSMNNNRLQQLLNLPDASSGSVYPLLTHSDRLSSANSDDSIRHHNHEDDEDGECDDFARIYCTEGTPHLSTAPSVTQLASELVDIPSGIMADHQMMQHQISNPPCSSKKPTYHQQPSETDYFSDSSEKPLDYSSRYKEQEDNGSPSTPPPLPPKKNQISRTSVGVVLPIMRSKQMPMTSTPTVQQQAENPRIYAVEGTPVNCQSRTSSLSSIFEVDEPPSSSSDPNSSMSTNQMAPLPPRAGVNNQSNSAPASVHRLKQRHQQLERIDERSGSESREVNSGASKVMKTVTFNEDTRVHVDMTPLVFSRCSSYSSLESFEAESVHSSVASDYSSSRRTSEVVSPSELPDSPGDTMPQSRNKSHLVSAPQKDLNEQKSAMQRKLEESNHLKERASNLGQRNPMKLLSGVPVAHDETKYFADEGTPLDTNSRKNSMDALHFYGLSSTLDEISGATILMNRSSSPSGDNKKDSKEDCTSGDTVQQRPISISTESSRSSSGPSSDEDAFADPQAILQQCINSAMPPPSHPNMKKSPSEPSGSLRLHVQPPPGPLPVMSSFKPSSAKSCSAANSESNPGGVNSLCLGGNPNFTSQQSIAATNTPASSNRNSHSNTTSSGSNRNSHSTTSSAGIPLSSDFLMTYAVEGTPLNYSTKASSLSELSIDEEHPSHLSPRTVPDQNLSSMMENLHSRASSHQQSLYSSNSNGKLLMRDSPEENSDDQRKSRATIDEESDTSSVNEECSELLSEVIQSAMPKRLPPSGSSGSAALSTRSAPIPKTVNNEPSTIIYPTLETPETTKVKQQPPKPPVRTASLISSDRASVDTTESLENLGNRSTNLSPPSAEMKTNRSTASNSVIDAPYIYQTEDTPAQHSRNSPVSHSLVNSPPLSIHRRPIGGSGNEETSNRSSLSSLSIDSVGLEKTLLQECISSAMPLPKSQRQSQPQSSKSVSPSSSSAAAPNPSQLSSNASPSGAQHNKLINNSKGSTRNKQGSNSTVLLTSLLALQQQHQQQRNKHHQQISKSGGHKTSSKSHAVQSKPSHNLPKCPPSTSQSVSKNSSITNEELVNNLARQHVAKEIREAESKTKQSSSVSRSMSQPTSPPLSANRKFRAALPAPASADIGKQRCKETPVAALIASTPPPLFPSSHAISVSKPLETRSTPVTPRLARANFISPSATANSSNLPNSLIGKDKARPSRSSSWFKSKNPDKSGNETNYKMVRSFSQDKDMSSRLFGFKRSPAAVPPDIGKSSSSLGAEANAGTSYVTQPSVGPPSVSSDAKTSSSTSFKKETGHFLDHCFGAGGLVPEAPKNDQKWWKQSSAFSTSGMAKSSCSSDDDISISLMKTGVVDLDEIEVDDSDDSSLEIDCHQMSRRSQSQNIKFSSTVNKFDDEMLDDLGVDLDADDDTDEEIEWDENELEDKEDSGIILEEKQCDIVSTSDLESESDEIHPSSMNQQNLSIPVKSVEDLSLMDSFSLVSASLTSSITDAQIDFTSDSALPFSSESSGVEKSSDGDIHSEDSTMMQESMSSSCDSLVEDIPNLPFDDKEMSPTSPPPLPLVTITSEEPTAACDLEVEFNSATPGSTEMSKEAIVNGPRPGPRIVKPTANISKPIQTTTKVIRGGQNAAERNCRSQDHLFLWNCYSSSEKSHLQAICSHQTVSSQIQANHANCHPTNSQIHHAILCHQTSQYDSSNKKYSREASIYQVQCEEIPNSIKVRQYENRCVVFIAVEETVICCHRY